MRKRNYVGRIMKGFVRGLVVLLVLSVGLGEAITEVRAANPGIEPNTIEVLPYQASAYRFLVIDSDSTPPSGFEQPGFDDNAFNTGDAAFGSMGGCPLDTMVRTFWPTDSDLLVRRVVSIPSGATSVRVMVSVDNDIVHLFFNGITISDFVVHDNCPVLDEFRFDVPQDLVEMGPNLVAFHVRDRGLSSFLDIRVLADLPTQPPNQPSNTSPADGATDVSLTPTFQCSSFSDPDMGDTHAASQWQVTTTAGDYSSPVFDSGRDVVNLTSITVSGLDDSTTYYWHVRHQDNYGSWSAYSTETWFHTGTPPTPVYISPASQTVSPGQVFTVDIYVEPAVPIMGVSAGLNFDPTLLTADSCVEGNLLNQDGGFTFFNVGIIDNVAGYIGPIDGAVLGGTVAGPGTFATITFTAGGTTSTSALDLPTVDVRDGSNLSVGTVVTGGSVTIEEEEPPPTPTPTPTPSPGPSEGCFIATAAYGSYLDSHVESLRDFRDSYMLTNPVGSALVSAYYKVSPPVAEFIDDQPALKPIVRVGLLPAVAMSTVAVSTTLAEKTAIVGSLALISVALAVWLRRRRGKLPR